MASSSSSSFSSFRLLLPDCRDHILQFLTLQECCRYGSTSTTSLLEVLPDLQRRRKQQFLLRHTYQMNNPSVLRPLVVELPLPTPPPPPQQQNEEEHNNNDSNTPLLQPPLSTNWNEYHWQELPSVFERIQDLYRSLPSSHPLDNDVRELFLDLQSSSQQSISSSSSSSSQFTTTTTSIPPPPPPPSTSSSSWDDVPTIIHMFHQITKAHRLHASLLERCTVQLNPTRCDAGFYTTTSRDNSNPNALACRLDYYMGDVLTAYYLMGHSISGVVEGGPTHRQWTNNLLLHLVEKKDTNSSSNRRSSNDHDDAILWYQLWVYVHSAVLRNSPFTSNQLQNLGLPLTCCGIQGSTIPDNIHYIHPHFPYMGIGTSVVVETTELIQAFSEQGWFTTFDHSTTFSHFGPLGPSFRGRDHVRTKTMDPRFIVHRLQPSIWFLRVIEEKQDILNTSAISSSWLTEEDRVISWMIYLKQECSKSRPMTVMPPLVTIEPSQEFPAVLS